jgi:hypothetical protein
MSKLDPRLRMLLDSTRDDPGLADATEAESVPLGTRLGWSRSEAGPAVEVIVEGPAPDDLQRLAPGIEYLGPATTSSIRVARVPIDALPSLDSSPGLTRIEAGRPMFAELNWSRLESRAEQVYTATPPVLGRGAVVAVIDSGIDYTHPCFRGAGGSTRIERIWDQSGTSTPAAPWHQASSAASSSRYGPATGSTTSSRSGSGLTTTSRSASSPRLGPRAHPPDPGGWWGSARTRATRCASTSTRTSTERATGGHGRRPRHSR